MNKIITLLTDFGEKGQHYVASLKGVILSINPRVTIVDISHSISSFSITETQYIIASTRHYFPESTVFVIVVDPGVGSSREIIAFKTIDNKYFIGPNNGIFSSISFHEIAYCVNVQNDKYFRHPVSNTFHGRDIIAPIGAYLTKEISLEEMGPQFDLENIVRIPLLLRINEEKKRIKCTAQFIDNFGNITTNIKLNEDNRVENSSLIIKEQSILSFIHENETYSGLFATHYDDIPKNETFFMKGSTNLLEISKNQAHAAESYKIKSGDILEIVF